MLTGLFAWRFWVDVGLIWFRFVVDLGVFALGGWCGFMLLCGLLFVLDVKHVVGFWLIVLLAIILCSCWWFA